MELEPQFPKPTPKRFKNDTKSTKNRSKSQERDIAKAYRDAGLVSARRVPGSGSFAVLPGDVDVEGWVLVEAKETRQGRLVVKPEWYDKIEQQSKMMGRPWWALHAWVAPATGNYRKVVVLDEKHFLELMGRLKAAEENG